MLMLTLSPESLELLKRSGLIEKYFQMCDNPQKYSRFIEASMANDEIVRDIANCNGIAEKIFTLFQKANHGILLQSAQLT